ncbi:MAG TPA: DnaA N-terminal domain-containing protein [Ktedonobacterales bacterium]|nr:DnaA N-terminal domain-containing protein [Ktedonobacterales bacterium]
MGQGARSSAAERFTSAAHPAASSTADNQALIAAAKQAGGTLATLLQQEFGASNPVGGALTILEAFVAVEAPVEVLTELATLGLKRLRQQQALGNPIQNQTGYYIALMRDLAWEALLKGWDVAQITQEDEEKYAQTQHSAGPAEQEAPEPAAEEAPLCEEREAAKSQTQEDQEPAEREARAAREESERYAKQPPDPQARQIWQSTLERIRPKVSSSAFTTWFSATKGLALEGETLIVRVGSSFGRDHLEQRFHDLIDCTVSEQRGIETETRFIVLPDAQEDN